MCFGSMRLARGGEACPPPDAEAEGRAAGHRGLRSFTLLVFASWVQIAFFRVLSTPELSGNRFTHYLIPFSFACVTSLVMLLLCMRMSRYLNVSLAYRWSLPLFMLSYVPIIIDYGNVDLRILAYAINFLGMFGVQFGCWIGACKYLRRKGGGTVDLFSRYALDLQGIVALSIALMSLVVFVAMATGFNPNWVFHGSHAPRGRAPEDPKAASASRAAPEAIFLDEAVDLQNRFGLTERETDVAALLLEGRSRPFIRDELVVSINTVSTHVRSIFAKGKPTRRSTQPHRRPGRRRGRRGRRRRPPAGGRPSAATRSHARGRTGTAAPPRARTPPGHPPPLRRPRGPKTP